MESVTFRNLWFANTPLGGTNTPLGGTSIFKHTLAGGPSWRLEMVWTIQDQPALVRSPHCGPSRRALVDLDHLGPAVAQISDWMNGGSLLYHHSHHHHDKTRYPWILSSTNIHLLHQPCDGKKKGNVDVDKEIRNLDE